MDSKLRDGLRRFHLVDLRSTGMPDGAGVGGVADYRLDVSLVRDLDGPVDATLVLNRVADQRTIWSQQVRLTEDEIPEFKTIEPIIAQIAGDYGVIVRDQIQRQPENFAPGFPCLAQFNRMRQMRNATNARQVETCLRATLDGNRSDPVTLMALSLLRFGDWQPRRDTAVGRTAFAEAHALAERAYQNGPNTTAGLFAMARVHFYNGNCRAGSAMGDAAVRQNPHDPDMAGFLGLFKVACGQMAQGEALLQHSVDLDGSHPGVPAVTLAFILAQHGESDRAMDILDSIPAPSNMEPQYLMVRSIVLARQGKLPEARAHWRRLLDYTGQTGDAPPERVLRQFMISPAVIGQAAAAVRDSGIAVAAPAR